MGKSPIWRLSPNSKTVTWGFWGYHVIAMYPDWGSRLQQFLRYHDRVTRMKCFKRIKGVWTGMNLFYYYKFEKCLLMGFFPNAHQRNIRHPIMKISTNFIVQLPWWFCRMNGDSVKINQVDCFKSHQVLIALSMGYWHLPISSNIKLMPPYQETCLYI